MTAEDRAAVTDRLRRALLAFRTAQGLVLQAHRRLKGRPPAEADAFWAGPPGRRVEATLRATARELVAAFARFSAAGLGAEAADRHLVTQAQRHLRDGA